MPPCSSARFANFTKISQDKQGVERVKALGGPQFPKWQPRPAWKAITLRANRVAFDASIERADFPALGPALEEVQGSRRCAQAQLLIVGCMQYLRELAAVPGKQHLCDLIYVIGRGVPVITGSTWKMVEGDLANVPQKSVVFHRPAAIITKKLFRYKREFVWDHAEVLQALRFCAELPKSSWQVQLDKGKPLAAVPKDTELIEVSDVASLGRVIIKARALEKGGCRAHAQILA